MFTSTFGEGDSRIGLKPDGDGLVARSVAGPDHRPRQVDSMSVRQLGLRSHRGLT